MRSVKIEKLTVESFAPYGWYADMLHPRGEHIGANPVKFFRDMLRLDLPASPSFSICRVETRSLVVDVTEIHNHTAEAAMCLDADTLMHFGPATPTGVCPHEKFRVFFVPKGTLVVTHAGVWHHAPFLFDKSVEAANTMIVLPERTYANDCVVVELPDEDRLRIDDDGFRP